MYVEGYELPEAWYQRTVTYLTRYEAENNLLLGLASTLMNDPSAYSDYYMAAVVNGQQVVGAAVMTPPYNLIISHVEHQDALNLLAEHVYRHYRALPGLGARKDVAHEFARLWTARTGQRHELDMAQRIYELREVKPPQNVAGTMRAAVSGDIPLLAEWQHAFSIDAGMEVSRERSQLWAERIFMSNLRRVWLWIADGQPVSMVGSTGPTPNGIRIGPVYTPQEFRGRGYASACTAAASQLLLNEGRKFCFLYTDLANPISNKIYQEIGYTPVCDADVIRFY